jgi:hypothetical protein
LVTAGATGGVSGSPMHPGFSVLGTICTSTLGNLVQAQHGVPVEVALLDAVVLELRLAVVRDRHLRPLRDVGAEAARDGDAAVAPCVAIGRVRFELKQ